MSYDWTKDDDECETYFGINIEKASPKVLKIIHKCIQKEKQPNY